MSKVLLFFLFSITLSFCISKFNDRHWAGCPGLSQVASGHCWTGSQAEPRPPGWPRVAGRGGGRTARPFSPRGAGHWIWNPQATLEHVSGVIKTPCLFPSLSREGLGGTEPERGWGKNECKRLPFLFNQLMSQMTGRLGLALHLRSEFWFYAIITGDVHFFHSCCMTGIDCWRTAALQEC